MNLRRRVQRIMWNPVQLTVRALDDQIVKPIFDHMRNLLMCATVFAVGAYVMRNPSKAFVNEALEQCAGIGIITVAAILTFLNLADGVHRLTRAGYNVFWRLLFLALYTFMSLRILLVAWQFRAS